MPTLITITTFLGIVVLALALCINSDRIEQRWRLKRFRKRMLSQPDFSDEQFAAAFSEIGPTDALEMRRMLAVMLGIDASKIRPEWRFREERDLKNLDFFIFHAFASRYAPDRLRNHQTFAFPTRTVTTVGDLFLETSRLQQRLTRRSRQRRLALVVSSWLVGPACLSSLGGCAPHEAIPKKTVGALATAGGFHFHRSLRYFAQRCLRYSDRPAFVPP